MRIIRIYQPIELIPERIVELDPNATHHLINVLRLKRGDSFIIFNGQGGEYEAAISMPNRRHALARINKYIERDAESPLQIHLGQAISRGEKMDFVIQKAVELGVTQITPLIAERCEWLKDENRVNKRIMHWQAVATSASEQCGRTKIVTILTPLPLEKWFQLSHTGFRFVLHHRAHQTLSTLKALDNNHVSLMIGPEGGWSDNEIEHAEINRFIGLQLGPRILRTETAALAAITALQCQFGDIQ